MNIDEFQLGEQLRILAIQPGLRNINPVVNQIKKQLPKGTKLISAGRKNTDIVMSGLIRVKRKRGQIKDLIKKIDFMAHPTHQILVWQSMNPHLLR